MGMVVRTNTMALNAYRQLGLNNSAVAKSLEKLASGYRINRAADDAAGLAISEKMKAQITGLETASANAQDGISLIQTGEGALDTVHTMLNRMVELATKSANGTYSATEREALQAEVDSLLEEIDRISQSTNYNGLQLLDGTMGLNTEAISIGSTVAAKTGDVIELSASGTAGTKPTGTDELPSKVADGTALVYATHGYHLTADNTAAINPEFTVDLSGMSVDVATGADGNLTVNIGATAVTLSVGAASTNDIDSTTATTVEASDIATAIAGKYAGSTTTDLFKIGDFYYKAAASGEQIKFTYAGTDADYTNGVETFTATQANTAANSPSADGKVTATGATGITVNGAPKHNFVDVVNAVAAGDTGMAGMDMQLTTDVMQDGYRLTIEDRTFVFKTDADSDVKAAEGEILVDVSAETSDTAKIEEAIDIMSNYQTSNFKIQAQSATVLHIEQLDDSQEKYDTYEKLAAQFSARTADVGQGVQVNFTADKLVAGNKINIDGTEYTFVEKATGANNEVVLGENGEDAVANLVTALENNNVKVTSTGARITVYGTVDAAPTVAGGGLTLQIGDTGADYNMITVNVANMSAKGLGVDGLNISDPDSARAAIDTIKSAINTVSSTRADLGALQNRIEYTIDNLDIAVENLSAANSRIRDTDMAEEMMNYTKMNVLVQSAQAMLAQANQQPQSVLQLLQ